MKILESKSTSILSVMIRWAFNSKGSHILFAFDNDKWIVQSNLLGVNIRLYENYMAKRSIVDVIVYDMSLDQEEAVFQALLKETSEDEYDYPGFAYFCWRALLYKFFKIGLPKKNSWGDAKMQLCTEMISRLPEWLTNIPQGVDLGITTPDMAMELLREAKK